MFTGYISREKITSDSQQWAGAVARIAGLGLIIGILFTLMFFWIRRKCRRRTKQRVEKRSWRERFLQAVAWGRPATQQQHQPATQQPLLPATQIVATPAHHPLVQTQSLHSHPSAPTAGLPALPPPTSLPALPAPQATNYPTVLYSPNNFL